MKKFFAIPILLFLAFIFAVYFLLPEYAKFGDLKKEVAQKESDVQKKQAELANLKEISISLQSEKESLDKIDSGLPNDFSVASLLSFLQDKSLESGLVLQAVNESGYAPGESREETAVSAKIKQSSFDLSLVGSFPAFENFVKALEKSARIIEVENVSFKENKDLLGIILQIKVYSYK